ncbi:hypothetical protein [Fulvivirga sp. M361]|uniref:hypothetical protein n=1 Tax=Fulvivirga sp. M361 TaxID=2594266 RepID=UPI0016267D99|nr:hypothetical protein [Fulvivirga sp. M361]
MKSQKSAINGDYATFKESMNILFINYLIEMMGLIIINTLFWGIKKTHMPPHNFT